jgi:hypothetical protein
MEAADSSETVMIYRTTRHHTSEEGDFYDRVAGQSVHLARNAATPCTKRLRFSEKWLIVEKGS